jgi:hypothetical protein
MGVGAGLLAGCGGATSTVIVQGPPTLRTSTSVAAPAGTQTTAATTATTAAGEAEAPARVVALETFQTPTGNIGCVIAAGSARCDILRRSWSPPPRPSTCPQIVNFGQGLTVGAAAPAGFVCAGDTVRDPASGKLAYGTASQVGTLVCVSRRTGMTCSNRQTGHGFLISLQRYRLF